MYLRAGRRLLYLPLLGMALTLAACSTTPSSTGAADGLARQWQSAAADGRFDTAFAAARSFERFNDPRAIGWYERAAATQPWTFHNTQAEEALGRIWSSGTLRYDSSPAITAPVLRASWRRGERWYLAAARHGNPYAFSGLARAYRNHGDAQQALRWDLRVLVYERMPFSASGLPDAVAAHGTTVHPRVAAIQRAAARGDAEAQVDLGALLERGVGLPRDPAQALQLYQRAGEQGDVFGQYFAGLLLGRGAPGVAKDSAAAAAWFTRAEAQRFYMAAPSYWQRAVEPPMFRFSK
ncbi:MAG: Secretory immunoglobulin A-binding protein EsiB [Stenotrophomonas maltophilia]|nr:MAG: Secretory immunoglobulin A-binding protein EsiB [Stenotrophomonas maltophilia]